MCKSCVTLMLIYIAALSLSCVANDQNKSIPGASSEILFDEVLWKVGKVSKESGRFRMAL